jgi:Flp pilus assembly protein TadD
VLAHTCAQQEDWPEAERAAREATLLSNGGTYDRATLAYVLARSGQRPEAERVLAELLALAARDYVSPVAFATIYLGLEEWEKALDWAERAYDDRRGWLVYLRVNPIVDPLRGRARFEALVRRMKLPS